MPDARIIVLTLMDSSTYRLASLAAGADDFVSRATMVTDLLPAIRRVIEAGLPTDCLVEKIPTRMTTSQRNWWPRNLAGNLDSPQSVVFITSIIDEIAGVST